MVKFLNIAEMAPWAVATVSALTEESFDDNPSEGWSEPALQTFVRQDTTIALTAQLDDQIVGVALGQSAGGEAELFTIVVAHDHRRSGVADALLAAFEAHADEAGATVLNLEVRENNMAARKFYEKNGFKVVGKRPSYYTLSNGEKVAAVLMRRVLNG